jgi:hypothetical protein
MKDGGVAGAAGEGRPGKRYGLVPAPARAVPIAGYGGRLR